MISTRNIGGSTDQLNDASQGKSGNINLTATNPDIFNPILNVNFDQPHVTLDSGSMLLAGPQQQLRVQGRVDHARRREHQLHAGLSGWLNVRDPGPELERDDQRCDAPGGQRQCHGQRRRSEPAGGTGDRDRHIMGCAGTALSEEVLPLLGALFHCR